MNYLVRPEHCQRIFRGVERATPAESYDDIEPPFPRRLLGPVHHRAGGSGSTPSKMETSIFSPRSEARTGSTSPSLSMPGRAIRAAKNIFSTLQMVFAVRLRGERCRVVKVKFAVFLA